MQHRTEDTINVDQPLTQEYYTEIEGVHSQHSAGALEQMTKPIEIS